MSRPTPLTAPRQARSAAPLGRVPETPPYEVVHALGDAVPLMLWTCDPDGRCTYFNRAWLAFTGRPLDEELGWGWREAMHVDDRASFGERFTQAQRTGGALTLEYRLRRADGEFRWVLGHGSPCFDRAGRLAGYIGSAADISDRREESEGIPRDVTARVHTQQQLRRSREQLRRLAARVESAREEERTALARELHDELGQGLTAIKMELMRANGVFQKARLEPKTVDRLQALIGLTEIAIATVKRISTDLRPPALDHLGLGDAIRWEGVTFRARTGLRCRVRAHGEGRSLTAHQQTVVFRIFQEALTNVVRHARASAVRVSLIERDGTFELQVQDNGRGITAAQRTDPTSIGLLGMRERAELIGGTFEISGRRGKGTVVTVRLPSPEAPTTTARRRAERRHS